MSKLKPDPEDTFPCKECGKVYTSESCMLIHLLQIHRHGINVEVSLEPFACSVCDFICNSYIQFINHIKIHKLRFKYGCRICSFKCNIESFFKSHMKGHHKKRAVEVILECDNDEIIVESDNHVKKHKLRFKYGCRICSYTCKVESNLKAHMTVHNKERAVEVILGSDKDEISVKSANDDLNNNESNVYTCSDCGKSYSLYSHLKWHLITHGNKKYYSCPECDYKTIYQFNLKLHNKQHNETKLIECSESDYKTKNEILLMNHKKRHEQIKDRKVSLHKYGKIKRKSESSTTTPSYINLSYFTAHCTTLTKAKKPKNICKSSKNQLQSNHNTTKQKNTGKGTRGKFQQRNGKFVRHGDAKNNNVLENYENIHQETEIKIGLNKYGNLKRKSALPFKCSYCLADCASLEQINRHKKIHWKKFLL